MLRACSESNHVALLLLSVSVRPSCISAGPLLLLSSSASPLSFSSSKEWLLRPLLPPAKNQTPNLHGFQIPSRRTSPPSLAPPREEGDNGGYGEGSARERTERERRRGCSPEPQLDPVMKRRRVSAGFIEFHPAW